MRRRSLIGGMLALSWPPARAATVVNYPRPERNDHPYHGSNVGHYPIRLLELALARSGRTYLLRPTEFMMTQSRGVLELQSGRAIDVMWTMTSAERERDLLPIRIPLYKGLIGWRLLLIRKRDAQRFHAIRQAEGLRPLDAVQGHDWPDTLILRANGFRVQAAADYGGMFKMLSSGRIDYFPRSAFEVWNELEMPDAQDLMVEPNLALHYPSAFYFFVNKSNAALGADIERGLELMLADGSFDRLFLTYHSELLHMAGLGRRQVIELLNPLLPEATPLNRRELWYRPEAGLPGGHRSRP